LTSMESNNAEYALLTVASKKVKLKYRGKNYFGNQEGSISKTIKANPVAAGKQEKIISY